MGHDYCEGDRGRAEGAAAGRAARLEGAPDLRPRPRGDLLGAGRGGRGCPRPRPLLRHRGAGDRGALPRRRRGRAGRSRPAAARGNVERLELGERVELVRSDAGALAGRAPRSPGAAGSTSYSSMPPIDSPTAWRRNSNPSARVPRRARKGRGRERRPPPAAARPLSGCASAATEPRTSPSTATGGEADERRREGTVVCPGSYDPVTNGHLDIITRTSAVFERVIVGVVNNPIRKEKTLFTAEERQAFIQEATATLGNVEVQIFSNLLVEFARESARRRSSRGCGRSPTSSTSSRWRSSTASSTLGSRAST